MSSVTLYFLIILQYPTAKTCSFVGTHRANCEILKKHSFFAYLFLPSEVGTLQRQIDVNISRGILRGRWALNNLASETFATDVEL